jgi:hypothetical protein
MGVYFDMKANADFTMLNAQVGYNFSDRFLQRKKDMNVDKAMCLLASGIKQ